MTPVTPEYVRERLEEAGGVLMMMPMPKNGRPSQYANNWPDIVRNSAELFGMQVFMDSEQRQSAANDRNRVRLHATARQIQRTDSALEWLWLIEDDVVRRVTLARSLKNPASGRYAASLRRLAVMFSCNHEHIRRLHYKGLCEISQKLAGIDTRDKVDDKGITFG